MVPAACTLIDEIQPMLADVAVKAIHDDLVIAQVLLKLRCRG